jgi:uncharacterized protein
MPRSAQTASEFQVELELLMYDDKTMKSSIYLRERGGQRLLRIDSGYQEATILNTLLTVVSIPRPLTHHAFLNTIRALGGELVRVLIDDVDNATSVFYSKLVIRTRLALSSVLVDSRPSDAIALALVAEAPIMVSPTAMRKIDLRERITEGE